MKILYLVKYFEPYDRGGSEWSTFNLASEIAKLGFEVTIATPNYGQAKSEDTIGKVKIKRFPFFIKLGNPKAKIAPYWTSNFIWFLYTTFYLSYLIFKYKYDFIHIQNNEFIPAGVIVGKIFSKKTLITFRDYQALCPHSFCLWDGRKACNLSDFGKDVEFFYRNYSKQNILSKVIVSLSSYRALFWTKVIFYFAKRADIKIAVSRYVEDIFRLNGICDMTSINNVVLVDTQKASVNGHSIVYVGKLSKGKGVDVLMDALKLLFKESRNSITFVGSGTYMKDLKLVVGNSNLKRRVNFLGQIPHREVLRIIRSASLLVAPSSWPEPLPRSVVESLLLGTPVVATRVGGISEIVDGKYGILVDKNNPQQLKRAIESILRKLPKYRSSLRKDKKFLVSKFSTVPALKYAKLYKQ